MLDWKSINQKAGANSAPPARQQASASQPYIPAKVSAPGTKKAKEEQRKALVQNSWLDNYNLSLPGGVGKMYAQAKPEVAQQAVNETNDMMAQAGKSGISRFGLRMLDSMNPAGSALNSIERTTGQKLDRSTITTPIAEDWNKSPANVLKTVKEQATDPGNIGMLVGTGIQYGMTGGLALERAVAGGMSKIPAIANASTKLGKVSSEIGKGIVSNTVGGAPINALMSADEVSVQENATGADFAKSMAINTALDVVLGGAIEGVSAFKRVRRLSKEKQAEVLKKVSEQTGLSEQEIKPLMLDAPAVNWDYGTGKMPDFYAGETGIAKNFADADVKQLPAPQNLKKELPKAFSTGKKQTKLPESDFYVSPGGQTAKDIRTADIKQLPAPKAENKAQTQAFAYADKQGVDKIKAKSDAYKTIKETLKVDSREDSIALSEILRDIDTNEKDAWDNDNFWKGIMDLAKKQPYEEIDVERLYPGLKAELRDTAIKVTDDVKSLTDFNATRKSNLGKLKFSKSGREVDKVYNSLSERYPDLFPDSVANPADQTEKIIAVANSLKSKTITVGEALNDDDLWTGSLGKVWGAIEKYRSTVKENVSYDNARGLKEAPRTAVRSELSEGVNARKLPQRTESKLPKKMPQKETSIYSIAKGQKEVPKTITKSELAGSKPQKKDLKETLTAQAKKEAETKAEVKKELPKKEVKSDDTSRKLDNRAEKKSDTRTEAFIEKLHRVARENPSIKSVGKLYEVSDHQFRNRVESIAKKFGVDTVFVKPLVDEADYFNGINMDGVLVISDKAENPINVVLGHELLHQLKKDNNAAYDKFAEIFKKELKGDKFEKYKNILQSAGKDAGKEYGYNEVIEEMIADFSGEMFNNPKIMQRIFDEDVTLAKKIYDIITEMIEKLKGNIKEAYMVSDGVKNLKAVQDEYVKLMKTAKNGGGAKFSIKKDKLAYTANRVKALKEFGTTENFNEAGYLMPDGKMLDFSGKKESGVPNVRWMDHRDINSIYDGLDNVDAMNQFISEGNIRMMPESPGLDINANIKPTVEQLSVIKRFIDKTAKNDYFSVDFSSNDGKGIDSLIYDGKVNSNKVVSDIQYFYNNGKTPNKSELDQFRFSLKKDNSKNEEYQYPKDNLRANMTKVRGGWTIEKIERELKTMHGSSVSGKTKFNRAISQFDSADELAENLYFHGTAVYIPKGLRAGSAIPRGSFRSGGYDEIYHTVSVSKSKNAASNFTGDKSNGSVYPVILRKGANVIERPDISDSIDLEDELIDLWNKGIDAVKVGDWKKEFSEQELVVLNPRALALGEPENFRVFQKKKFDNPSKEELNKMYNDAKLNSIDDVKFSLKKDYAVTSSEKLRLNRLSLDDKLDGYRSRKEVLENAEKLLQFIKEKEHQISLTEYMSYNKIQGTGRTIPRTRSLDEIRTVANAITEDLVNYGEIDLRGMKVNTSKDLAMICQVYRNPRFETLRYFYVKNGEVVGHEGVTCKIPGMTRVAPGDPRKNPNLQKEYLEEVKNRMAKMEADSLYLVHNHPSGIPDPSNADIQVTTDFADKFGDKFAGHVVIDSNKYSYISKYGITSTHDLNVGDDLILKPSIVHPANGKMANSPDLLADIAKQLQVSEDVSSIVFTDVKLRVRAIQEVPNNAILEGNKTIENHITEKMVAFGSAKAFLLYSKTDAKFLDRIDELMESGHTLDAINTDNGYSFKANGGYRTKEYPDGVDVFTAESVDVKFSLKRDSEGKTLTAKQAEYFKDSKVRDKDGNLLVVYHGSPFDFTEFNYDPHGHGMRNYEENLKKYEEWQASGRKMALPWEKDPYPIKLKPEMPENKGYFFSDNAKVAKTYGNEKGFYLALNNPKIVDMKGKSFHDTATGNRMIDLVRKAKADGYDGIIEKNVRDSRTYGENDEFGTNCVAFYPEQIKAIDNQNPTPGKDIRYSLKYGMASGLHRARVKEELKGNDEYQEIISELEDIMINDDPIIEHISKSIKDHKGITTGMKDIHRNMRDAFGVNYPIIKEKYLNPLDKSKKDYVTTIKKYTDTVYNDITKGLKIKKGSKESAAVQWIGEGKRQMGWEWQFDEISGKKYKTIKLVDYTLDDLQADFPNKWKDIKTAADKMRTLYDSLIDEVNETRRKIYPTNQSKLVPKRKDYFRHYREMASSFEGLWNAFSSPSNIDSKLAGISEYTQPKTKWASYMQQRGMGKYKEDAIGGFLDYIGPASYSINIDPHISKFRGLAKQIAEATVDTKNANGTITYIHDFANSLAGKSVDLDRLFNKLFGRKALVVLSTLNNRVKKNQILLNARSALSQVANIPLGIAKIKNPMVLIPGAGDAISSIAGVNPKVNELYKESAFISERYAHDLTERFNNRMIDKPEQFAGWLLEAFDQMGTKFIWNSAYRSAFDKGIEDAIQYADDVTRSLVAGRGIGEVPLIQQSKTFQLIAPFQLEVANLWHVFGDMRRDKDFAGIVLILLGNYLFNNAYEEAVGDRVVFDPIDAVAKSIREGNTADETAGRLAGEFFSNVPLGQSFAEIYPEYGKVDWLGIDGLLTRRQLFGDEDPTRYGSGTLLIKAVQDPIYKLLTPLGGNQAKKTIDAVKALNKGEVSKDGKINYLVEKKPENIVKGALFGKYAFDEGKDYTQKDRRPLTEKQSEAIRNSDEPKVAYEKKMVLRQMETIDGKIADVKKNEELSEKQKNKEIVKLLREKIKEIKTTDLYTEEEKSQKILRLQGQILRYEE